MLLCGGIYRSPSGNKEEIENSTKEIEDIINIASGKKTSHLLIVEDFNLPGIDWEYDYVGSNQKHLIEFVNTIQNCFLFQHVKSPTR